MLAQKPFVKKPGTTRIGSGGGSPDHCFDRGRSNCAEKRFQNSKVKALIFEGKGQVALDIGGRRMSRCINCPTISLIEAVSGPYGRECPGERHLKGVGANKRRIPHRDGFFRQASVLKNSDRA